MAPSGELRIFLYYFYPHLSLNTYLLHGVIFANWLLLEKMILLMRLAKCNLENQFIDELSTGNYLNHGKLRELHRVGLSRPAAAVVIVVVLITE